VYPNTGNRGTGRREFSNEMFRALMTVLLSGSTLLADEQSAKNDRAPKGQQTQDDVYEPGGDVKPPKLVHYVEPDFSPSSKEAYVEGTVKISTVVTREGIATNLRVTSGLNAKEDQTALDAVKQWKFEPGTKAGQAVNVRVNVEVTFHLL
jgi:TonB family protein